MLYPLDLNGGDIRHAVRLYHSYLFCCSSDRCRNVSNDSEGLSPVFSASGVINP